MSQLESDVNRDGSDYKDFVAAGVNECLEACGSDAQCEAIAFTKSSRQCWMKSAVPLRQSDARYTSAVKVGGCRLTQTFSGMKFIITKLAFLLT